MKTKLSRSHLEGGFIPMPMLIVLLIAAALGGGLAGFIMGKGFQGMLITAAVAVTIFLAIARLPELLRWINTVKREARKK